MKSSLKFTKVITLFTMLLVSAGCASVVEIKDTSTTPNSFSPSANTVMDTAPVALLRAIRVLDNERESKPSEWLLFELQDKLRRSHLFSEVGFQTTANRQVVLFDITLKEEKDDHNLVNVPKAFFTGLTLGLLSPLLPLQYDRSYTLEVMAYLQNGRSQRYVAKTEATMAINVLNSNGGIVTLHQTTLDRTLDAWLVQMAKDVEFFTPAQTSDTNQTTLIDRVIEAVNKERYTLKPTPDPLAPFQVYIPANVEDAFIELKKMMHPSFLEEFKGTPEDRLAVYHFGLGRWIRNNWALWKGSRLSQFFTDLGITHPDDMSGIVLTSFHRSLRDLPLQLDRQVRHYQAYWRNIREREPSVK